MGDVKNPIVGYADSYRLMQRDGAKTIDVWSIITDLERNMVPAVEAELAALREELAIIKDECIDHVNLYKAWTKERDDLQQRLTAAEQRNVELVELLRDTRDLVRPSAVLSPDGEFSRLKARLDAALLNSPEPTPGERIPGCADAAWLLYDGNLYGQHGVLVMDGATILQKATSYAGYKPTESGASE